MPRTWESVANQKEKTNEKLRRINRKLRAQLVAADALAGAGIYRWSGKTIYNSDMYECKLCGAKKNKALPEHKNDCELKAYKEAGE